MSALTEYLRAIHHVRATGGGTSEESYYPALAALLDHVGKRLKPPVRAVFELKNLGAGHPDFGLYTAEQFERADGGLRAGHVEKPARGVGEVKGAGHDLDALIASEQVERYLAAYGLLLATNLRQFAVVVPGPVVGQPIVVERFSLGDSEGAFWATAARAKDVDDAVGDAFEAFIERALRHAAPVDEPKDLAWFLASYAREARARLDRLAGQPGGLAALAGLRDALETTLGARFRGERGERFFRATVVQTLFYGVFSAWTLWHREQTEHEARGWKDEHGRDTGPAEFRWRFSVDYLHVPVLAELFHQLTGPKVRQLGLTDLLDRTERLLARVRRARFFARFRDAEAVQYFYEPFLEAYDPVLRKQLGVWYTPPEVVRYMVARVDRVLKDELGEPDGLASERVVVLDPACGTGAFLVEVLRHVRRALEDAGAGATVGSKLRQAATRRLFGFELLTAPFVVAHLQLGLALRAAGAPLGEGQRAAVYLTNALTGWVPTPNEGQRRLAQEFEEEVEAARHVKRDERILVVIGNPPYEGHPGLAYDEERALVEAYRHPVSPDVPKPEGRGLNDLYVRFFRVAERQITERTRRGVVCLISNNSWLDWPSYPAMRERFLNAFDRIWIDNLHGDSRRTGKLTPEGDPDPSIFSTPTNREGIRVGTAIAVLARTEEHEEGSMAEVRYRDFWGSNKLATLDALSREGTLRSLGADASDYTLLTPVHALGLPLLPRKTTEGYLEWPTIPDLFPAFFPGIFTARDGALVDVDRSRLEERMARYFDSGVTDAEVKESDPVLMSSTSRFNAPVVRRALIELKRRNEGRGEATGRIIPYLYRPFDVRWLFWIGVTNLLDRERAEYLQRVPEETAGLVTSQRYRRGFDPPIVSDVIASLHVNETGTSIFPFRLKLTADDQAHTEDNLSERARRYLRELGATTEDLFHHALAVLHAPAYRAENAGALKQDWPRVPLPTSTEVLAASADLGRRVAALLDPSTDVPGVTAGSIRPELRRIAVPERADGTGIDEHRGHTAVTARWGYLGSKGQVMPGTGHTVEHPAPTGLPAALGSAVVDVYLNDATRWAGVPRAVWAFTLGGYPVLKKWLSYRQEDVLGRPLSMREVEYFQTVARRIAALLLLADELDASYAAVRSATAAEA